MLKCCLKASKIIKYINLIEFNTQTCMNMGFINFLVQCGHGEKESRGEREEIDRLSGGGGG